jgi:hypothetical protein
VFIFFLSLKIIFIFLHQNSLLKYGYNTVKLTNGHYLFSVNSNVWLKNTFIEVLDDIGKLLYTLNIAGGMTILENFNSTAKLYSDFTWYKLQGGVFLYKNSGILSFI